MEFLLDYTRPDDEQFLGLKPPSAWYRRNREELDSMGDDPFLGAELLLTGALPIELRTFLVASGWSVNAGPVELAIAQAQGEVPEGGLLPGQLYENKYDNWTIEPDASISPHHPEYMHRPGHIQIGVEVISPKLVLSQANLLEVKSVLDSIDERYRIWNNESTAVHVNIGNDLQGFPRRTVRNLFQFFIVFEDEIATLLGNIFEPIFYQYK